MGGGMTGGGVLGGGFVDALDTLTEPPAPNVKTAVGENEPWARFFDDTAIDPGNDDDGTVDSGETVHLAISLMNRGAGRADDVTVTLRARAEGAVFDDPYVTLLTSTVKYGVIEPYTTVDNGLIYDQNENVTGVENPFVFSVDPNCPNDHEIEFELTIGV